MTVCRRHAPLWRREHPLFHQHLLWAVTGEGRGPAVWISSPELPNTCMSWTLFKIPNQYENVFFQEVRSSLEPRGWAWLASGQWPQDSLESLCSGSFWNELFVLSSVLVWKGPSEEIRFVYSEQFTKGRVVNTLMDKVCFNKLTITLKWLHPSASSSPPLEHRSCQIY